jgi:hypothetical protein
VRSLPARLASATVLLGWLAALLGGVANWTVFQPTGMTAQAQLGFQPLKTAAVVFYRGAAGFLAAGDRQHLLAYGWLVFCSVVAIFLFWRLRCAEPGERNARCWLALFLVFAAGSSVLSAGLMIAGGSNGLTVFKDYVWTMHYMHPMFLLPLLGWPVVISVVPAPRSCAMIRALTTAAAALCLIGPAALLLRTQRPEVPIHRWSPPFVKNLDAQARRYGLRYGLAGYWQARLITLLSTTGLRAYQVDGSLNPFLWVSNQEWYGRSLENPNARPCFNFFVLNDPLWKISRETITTRVGPPSAEFQAGGAPVLVYSGQPATSARDPQVSQEPKCVTPF